MVSLRMKASRQKGVKRSRHGKRIGFSSRGFKGALPGPIRSLVAEKKCCDVSNGGSPPIVTQLSTTYTATSLNTLVLGSDSFNRIGRRVQMWSLHLHGKIADAGHVAADDYVRIMVVYDRESKQAAPAQNDLFEAIDNAGNVSNTVWDDMAVGSFGRFDVLANLRIDYSGNNAASNNAPAAATTDYKGEFNVDRFIKLKGLTANYGTGSNVAETGGLYLCTLGSIAAGSNPMLLEWTARLRYTDF